MGDKEKPNSRIVEFLYRDIERLSSLYAQHFGADLLEIASTSSASETAVQNVGASIAVVAGHVEHATTNTTGETHRSDPHDMKILTLLNQLNLPVTRAHLSGLLEGRIMILQGELYIRSYTLINKLIGLFSLPEMAKMIPGIDEMPVPMPAIESMLNSFPLGLELELENSKGQRLIGPMKPEALLLPPDDLMATYGTKVPGEWYVLGIVDAIKGGSATSKPEEISAILDQFAELASAIMRPQDVVHRIIPILIFRYLEKAQ